MSNGPATNAGANGADPLKDIRDAVNDATRNARNGYLFFVLAGLYVAVLVGSTTDEMLLRGTTIKLPVFEVGIPIVVAYAVIPILFLLLHFNMLVQSGLLAHKVRDFEGAAARQGLNDAVWGRNDG